MTLIEKIIVLQHLDNRILFPTKERINFSSPPNYLFKPFFMCSITSYDNLTGTLGLRILRQSVGLDEFMLATEKYSDLLLSLNIKSLTFTETKPKFNNPTLFPAFTPEEAIKNLESLSRNQSSISPIPVIQASQPITLDIDTAVAIKDFTFLDGKVSFEHYVKQLSRVESFEIHNSFLKKEFDSVKNYFAKVFATKKLTVTIQIEIEGNRITKRTATSPKIAQIDESLFEQIEDIHIYHGIINSTDEEIYTLKERATKSAKEIGSEEIDKSAWLLDKLLRKDKTKHYYHLRFLSGKHLSNQFNLRLTGKPLSFIFILQGNEDYFLVWETYSTQEATYIWKMDAKDRHQLPTQVEERLELIKRLRKNTKLGYLSSKPQNFTRIEHEYSDEDLGFNNWKFQLEAFLKEGKA